MSTVIAGSGNFSSIRLKSNLAAWCGSNRDCITCRHYAFIWYSLSSNNLRAEKPIAPRYATISKVENALLLCKSSVSGNARYGTRHHRNGQNLGCMKIRREHYNRFDSGHSRAGRGPYSSPISFSSLRRSMASITVHRATSRRFRSENSCRRSLSSMSYSAS